MDLPADRVEVYRQPSPGVYRDVQIHTRAPAFEPVAFPDLWLTVADLLG